MTKAVVIGKTELYGKEVVDTILGAVFRTGMMSTTSFFVKKVNSKNCRQFLEFAINAFEQEAGELLNNQIGES